MGEDLAAAFPEAKLLFQEIDLTALAFIQPP